MSRPKLLVLCSNDDRTGVLTDIRRVEGIFWWRKCCISYCHVEITDDCDFASDTVCSEYGCDVIVHPALKRKQFRKWRKMEGLHQLAHRKWNIVLPSNDADFPRQLSKLLRDRRLDSRSRLCDAMNSAYGSLENWNERIQNWCSQFEQLGVAGFGDVLLSTIEVIEHGDLRTAFRFAEGEKAKYVLLNGTGSDHEIRRQMSSMLGMISVPTLAEQLLRGRTQLILLVDSIHSGEQLKEVLLKYQHLLHQGTIQISVRPAHATDFGVARIMRTLSEEHLENAVTFETQSTFLVHNEIDVDPGKVPELELRLKELRYDSEKIRGILRLCRNIGAQLKQQEDGSDFPDLNVGLGGFSLGLTSMVGGYPGKGVLPLLRLGGPIELRVGDNHPVTKKIQWKPLMIHSNASGLG